MPIKRNRPNACIINYNGITLWVKNWKFFSAFKIVQRALQSITSAQRSKTVADAVMCAHSSSSTVQLTWDDPEGSAALEPPARPPLTLLD